jgi:hypothetical protein
MAEEPRRCMPVGSLLLPLTKVEGLEQIEKGVVPGSTEKKETPSMLKSSTTDTALEFAINSKLVC